MSSIVQRPNGKWLVSIREVGFKPKYKSFDRKVDAERWDRKVRSEMDRGLDSDLSELRRTSVGDLFARFEREEAPKRRGARWEIVRLRSLQTDALAHRRLDQDVPHALREWVRDRLQEVSPNSVIRELALISTVFTTAIKRWALPLPVNPVSMIERPKATNDVVAQLWTPEMLDRLRDAARDAAQERDDAGIISTDWVVPALELALETAMRLKEVCSCRVTDVHLEERRIRLAGSDTKTGRERNVLLSSRAVEIVRELLAMPRGADDRLVPVLPDTLGLRFRQLRAAAGLEGIRFRDSRHTATTRAADKFDNVLELAAFTGHTRIEQLQTYFHPKTVDLAKKLG